MENDSVLNISIKLKNELKNCNKSIIQLILIGNAKLRIQENNDLDFIVIVENNVSKFDFVLETSSIIANLISNSKIQISCFPITKSEFSKSDSMFIRNIKKDGIII